MSINQHSRFNSFLNGFVNEKSKIKYKHLYEIDQFFDVKGVGKVRNTVDEKTGLQKNCIIKQKMGNLEVYMPSSNLDYRISVNLEMVLNTPLEDEYPTHSRKKDRLSYSLFPFQIDLTQVTNQGVIISC
jgi:polynucleotide 5'-triphosphatase